MKIKHSKFRNTGLIFELLVKQIAADTLENRDSAGIAILKKYFTGNSYLLKELKLYDLVSKNSGVSQRKAEVILSTITEVSRNLNSDSLKKVKYNLIADIKENYDVNEFFAIQLKEYKAYAALYCLIEAYKSRDVINPDILVENKTTILQYLTEAEQDKDKVKDSLIEEYSKFDKDLKLLTFKILLEKFNNKYKDLLPEQKNILKQFIVSVNSSKRLHNFVNEELNKIQEVIVELKDKVDNEITSIKLEEVSKMITPIKPTEKVTDNHLVNLMQYYELIKELKTL